MTLIIAKKTKSQIIILSDTRIFDPKGRSSLTTGLLKTTFLSPDVALAFTGNPDLAERHVVNFQQSLSGHTPFAATRDFFRDATIDNENEYVLAFAGPRRIFKLAAGRIHEDSNQIWLGSKKAFERFQQGPASSRSDLYQADFFGPDLPDVNVLADRYSRFQNVVESPDIQEVGGFTTLTVSPEGRFRFTLQGSLLYDSFSTILGPRGNRILSSTPHNRDYRYVAWAPEAPAIMAMAYVYPSAKKAFLFHQPGAAFAGFARLYDGLTGDELTARLETDTGYKFLTLDVRHFTSSMG